MIDVKDEQSSAADGEIEREIREARKFSLADAIGRLAGPGAMKGESPVPRLQQAEMEIASWLRTHLADAGGVLGVVLHRAVKDSDLLLNNPDQPLVVLAAFCQRVLGLDYLLGELARQADVEWGAATGERPHFEQEGRPRHSNDPYTVESVRIALSHLVQELAAREG